MPTEDLERPTRQWDVVLDLQDLAPDSQHAKKLLTTMLDNEDWPTLIPMLRERPSLMDEFIIKGDSWQSVLQHLVRSQAPENFIVELIQMGAYRTVRGSLGQTAADIAIKGGFDHLVPILTPVLQYPVECVRLDSIQELFHGLIRATIRQYNVRTAIRLPQLSVLTEFANLSLWVPIPGMYGGFHFWLEGQDSQANLISESWCRVSGGSGMRHQISPVEITLLDSGFV